MRAAALSVWWSITPLRWTPGSKYLLSAYPHVLLHLRRINAEYCKVLDSGQDFQRDNGIRKTQILLNLLKYA